MSLFFKIWNLPTVTNVSLQWGIVVTDVTMTMLPHFGNLCITCLALLGTETFQKLTSIKKKEPTATDIYKALFVLFQMEFNDIVLLLCKIPFNNSHQAILAAGL